MLEAGDNYGLTGLLDIGTTSASKLIVTVYGFGAGFEAHTHKITGPGSNFSDKVYSSNVGGSLSFVGDAKPDFCPFPMTMHNLQGTLTIQYNSTNCTVAFPVLLGKVTIDKNAKTENMLTVKGTAEKNGAYVLTWPGTISYTQPTLVLSQLFAGTHLVSDPNELTTSATEVWFLPTNGSTQTNLNASIAAFEGSAVPPLGELKFDACTAERLDDAAAMLTVRWALNDSVDREEFPHTFSSRSSDAPFRDSIGEVVVASSNVATQVNTLWDAFQQVPFSLGVKLYSRTDGKRLAVYEYINPGSTLRGRSKAPRWTAAKMNGTNPQMYILSNIAAGAGRRTIQFSATRVYTPVRRFLLVRNLSEATIPDQSPAKINGTTMPFIGTTNNALFLSSGTNGGFAVGTCLYQSPSYTVRLGLSGTPSIVMGYEFIQDALGIVDGVPESVLQNPPTFATNYTQTGWTNILSLGAEATLMLASVQAPPQNSFAAFTA